MPFLNQPTHITYGELAGLSLASYAMYKFWKHRSSSKRKEKEKTRLAEVTTLRQHIESLQAEARQKDDVVASCRKELGDKRSQLSEVERLLNSARSTATSLEAQIQELRKQLSSDQGELQRAKEQQEETQKLLKARTQELKGAEVFLTKADTHSGADVITMLNALNTEIYQTAAVVAESFTFSPRTKASPPPNGTNGHADPDHELAEVHASTMEIVGNRMTELLRTSDHSEDPTLVQIAFQAGMSAYAHWIVTSWYFDEPEDDRLLADIYKRLRVQEEQAVSGRWRALTRSYAHRESNHEPDLSIYIFDAFINILITAGINSTPSVLHDTLAAEFGERVSLLIKYAQTLRKAVGENITSCDFETVHVGQDRLFESGKMDDTLGGGSTNDEELVLCTTDLGLLRVARKPGPTGQVGELEEAILLRPKVVLQSGIEDLLSSN